MKIFPRLAQRTNLTPEELKTYFLVNHEFCTEFNSKNQMHESQLKKLCLALLRAGRINFEMNADEETGGIGGQSDLKQTVDFSQAVDARVED